LLRLWILRHVRLVTIYGIDGQRSAPGIPPRKLIDTKAGFIRFFGLRMGIDESLVRRRRVLLGCGFPRLLRRLTSGKQHSADHQYGNAFTHLDILSPGHT
jgi:hypothetical protein